MEEDIQLIKKENNKNHRKIWLIICILLVILLLGGGGYYYYTNYYSKDNNTKEVVEKPNLKDDFYANINFKNKDSVFTNAQLDATENLSTVGMEVEKDPNFKNDNYFIFIDAFDDLDEREKRGIDDLKPYFDEIDKADTLDKFSDIFIKVSYDLGVNTFLNFGINPDLYNNSRNVILFEPIVLEKISTFLLEPTMSSGLEFFTNEKYATYKTAFEKGRVKYFKQYGYDEKKAKQLSDDITNFAKTIQAKSQTIDEIQGNYVKYYKNYTKNELKALLNNLPIDKLLAKFNVSNYQYFAIIDEGQIKELDNYYKEENLPLMKEILKLMILEDIASFYTSSDYIKILADVFSTLSGTKLSYSNLIAYYEFLELRPEIMGSYLNVKYDERYFTDSEKQEMRELINKIKTQYVEVIKNSDWLEESTREEAIKKLNNMKINIGYTPDGSDNSNVKLVTKENGGSLISNYILLTQGDSDNFSKVIKEVHQQTMSQFKANAYYNPMDNSINFPSAFREVYRNIDNKYEIYAYAGMVIGHEISHAFDSNGSQFDEKGNVKNWWTNDDKNDYDTLKQKIVNYYSQYDIQGVKIDGELTVSENIADLASVKTILSIMESENATNDDYKKFFEAYAKLWADDTPMEMIKLQMVTDNHSPNKIRVNAVLSSMDKFYEIYDIKEGDKMFVAKENRVGLW